MTTGPLARARIDVVGLGPAGPGLITADALALLETADAVWLRTRRHPSADAVPRALSFDHHYDRGESFDQVYRAIVEDLVAAALGPPSAQVVYAVPGSPTVAERSVIMLGQHAAVVNGELDVCLHPSVSFLDLAFARLGVDPATAGVQLVDGESFAVDAAGQRGPLLVSQCWSTAVLSDIKLSVETAPARPVTVLHHLGLDDEEVWEVAWDELDRSFTPDHLTSLWIPELAAPVAAELVRLDELVHTLRLRCPWDRRQTHGSLARHLLEESYEVLEAIDAVAAIDGSDAEVDHDGPHLGAGEEQAVAHLEEELGDLLFQVYFHALLAAEAGRFTLADVARGVHDKLVGRHPHVFGDGTATTSEEVATNWEANKMAEKGRSSVTEGIPAALPALAVAAKLQRKALAVGMVLPALAEEAMRVADGVAVLGTEETRTATDGEGGERSHADQIGDLFFSLVSVARSFGVDPETALRARSAAFRRTVEERG
jgi:tetrapyrrole methylase family protein / MazG family protein